MAPEPRLATLEDLPAIRALIPLSVRALSTGHYSPGQIDASLRHVFGADTQLVRDGTYYVIEDDDGLLACGGWSRRRTLYGGDQLKQTEDPVLDPATEAARIRAFFVHPRAARRGLGRRLLETCTAAARAAGFGALELGATLPGVALYQAFGFAAVEQIEQPMPGGLALPIVRMRLTLT
ncbi:MAG TPA: GNAT family N-acetyltransferase [Myxococcales bacterium]|jgi:GNAT superfamily N-acetyltransferase|nr:GNAT family N-acetyltransferase [Myxococcales bacterium]